MRCMEVELKAPGVFTHKGPVQEWRLVAEDSRLAAVRKVQDIDFGEWTALYEVDRVVFPGGELRETTWYLVDPERTWPTLPP